MYLQITDDSQIASCLSGLLCRRACYMPESEANVSLQPPPPPPSLHVCLTRHTQHMFTPRVRQSYGSTVNSLRLCSYYTGLLLRRNENHTGQLLFTHKNGNIGAISVIEQSCNAPISKVESHVWDKFSCRVHMY